MSMFEARLGAIPADFYHRADVLDAEIEHVFKPAWVCAGFTEDLKNPNDFLTTRLGKHSIVVQNMKGEIRAFRNVCAHRFSRIQCDAHGNRPLTCPYHGWTYDGEGKPIGIPMNGQSFQFDDADRARLALDQYEVSIVGNFVFVRMMPGGEDLKTFLGAYYEELEHLSAVCTDRVENERFEWRGNWKLSMDNSGEAYHVPLVHSENFQLILNLDLEISTEKEHSRYFGTLKERSIKWWAGVCKSIGVKRSERYQDYVSFLIYPNIIITFSYGAFMTFQTFDPVAPDRFVIKTAAWLAQNRGGAARPVVHEALRAFTAHVRDDDEKILAVNQDGVEDVETIRPPMLGVIEGRTKHFQQAYMAHMQGRVE
jgi:choline monooxygenase